MKAACKRLPRVKIDGKTHEERCEDFLRGMLANGMAKVVLDEASIDQHEIRICMSPAPLAGRWADAAEPARRGRAPRAPGPVAAL